MTPAIFIDRDGTIMEDVPYIRDPAHVRLFPGVREAIEKFAARGYRVVIVTNQSGIGRGWVSLREYAAVQARLFALLGPAHIDAVYMCPDAPDVPSDRRKPCPGMVLEAAVDLALDLGKSWFVGDKESDMECASNAGVRGIQVATGEGSSGPSGFAFHYASDFAAAAEFLLAVGD